MNSPVATAHTITPVKAFDDNYIWCIEVEGQEGFVAVDPGDAQVVLDFAKQQGQPLVGILVTHHHADHTGGIKALVQHFTDIPVYGPSQSPYPHITHSLKDTDSLTILGMEFTVMEIPGHTLDHIAFYNADSELLFCGDTLFLAGCGRVFEGTPKQMHQSLNKIMSLPAMTKAYPTHEYSLANLKFAMMVDGDNDALQLTQTMCQEIRAENQVTLPTRLAQEAAINPFVRTENPAVIASAIKHAGYALNSPAEVFTVLREWKNSA